MTLKTKRFIKNWFIHQLIATPIMFLIVLFVLGFMYALGTVIVMGAILAILGMSMLLDEINPTGW